MRKDERRADFLVAQEEATRAYARYEAADRDSERAYETLEVTCAWRVGIDAATANLEHAERRRRAALAEYSWRCARVRVAADRLAAVSDGAGTRRALRQMAVTASEMSRAAIEPLPASLDRPGVHAGARPPGGARSRERRAVGGRRARARAPDGDDDGLADPPSRGATATEAVAR